MDNKTAHATTLVNLVFVEASDLAWNDMVPDEFWYAGRKWLHMRTERDRENEVVAWHYRAVGGSHLTVFND